MANNLNFGKGIPLTAGFDLGAELPLDARVVVETFDDLQEHVDAGAPGIGLVAYEQRQRRKLSIHY